VLGNLALADGELLAQLSLHLLQTAIGYQQLVEVI
jgi:hypothetical protein